MYEYQQKERIPVHYLLYNPFRLPIEVTIPLQVAAVEDLGTCEIGCRVIGASKLDSAMQALGKKKEDAPSISDISAATVDLDESEGGWRLEHYIVDLLLGCKEGYIGSDDPTRDRGLMRVFGGRTAPISAAISITIDAPG